MRAPRRASPLLLRAVPLLARAALLASSSLVAAACALQHEPLPVSDAARVDVPPRDDIADVTDAADVADAGDVADATDVIDVVDVMDAADADAADADASDAPDVRDAPEVCAPPRRMCGASCVDTTADPMHCGDCGRICTLPNATAGCAAGACAIASCLAGFADCDGMAANGCETNLNTSVAHCGMCGNACALPGGTNVCTAGACAVTMCRAGRGDCDGNMANGCETDLTNTEAHCGACGNACAARPNTTFNCNASACAYTCTAGFGDCDGMAGNGCETDVTATAAHCGACGTACAPRANATVTCAARACAFTCAAGFGNCDGNATNGCETTLATSPTHCGACGNACPARANAAVSCDMGACRFACMAGFGDCDMSATNGCEAALLSSTAHCGACGNACATGQTCSAGVCRDPATQVTAGYAFTCARRGSGAVSCWGEAGQGHLGNDDDSTNRTSPVAVVGTMDATRVNAQTGHTCAIRAMGQLWCWGAGASGQLGNGGMTNQHVPVRVTGLTMAVTDVAVGGDFTCALLANESVVCWGANDVGQLGDNMSATRTTPGPAVSSLNTDIVDIDAGEDFACALRRNGNVHCWGSNEYGQLGNGSTAMLSRVAVLVSGIGDATSIDVGTVHACARRGGAGVVNCWGRNHVGQLGNMMSGGISNTPVAVSGLTGTAEVSAGGDHTCARLTTGAVRCWGSNSDGQLGDNTTDMRTSPVSAMGITDATSIGAGGRHTCAVRATGGVVCWGLNGEGQLGTGSTANSRVPVPVMGIP